MRGAGSRRGVPHQGSQEVRIICGLGLIMRADRAAMVFVPLSAFADHTGGGSLCSIMSAGEASCLLLLLSAVVLSLDPEYDGLYMAHSGHRSCPAYSAACSGNG